MQYFAVEWTKAVVAICRVVAPAPQPEPASCLRNATSDISFLKSDSRCRWYVPCKLKKSIVLFYWLSPTLLDKKCMKVKQMSKVFANKHAL